MNTTVGLKGGERRGGGRGRGEKEEWRKRGVEEKKFFIRWRWSFYYNGTL